MGAGAARRLQWRHTEELAWPRASACAWRCSGQVFKAGLILGLKLQFSDQPWSGAVQAGKDALNLCCCWPWTLGLLGLWGQDHGFWSSVFSAGLCMSWCHLRHHCLTEGHPWIIPSHPSQQQEQGAGAGIGYLQEWWLHNLSGQLGAGSDYAYG